MHRQVSNSSVKVVLGKVLPCGRKGVRASAKTHRGEDAQAKPTGTPERLLLHLVHILQRPERGTVNRMAETHAQSVSKTSKGGGEEEGHGDEGTRNVKTGCFKG